MLVVSWFAVSLWRSLTWFAMKLQLILVTKLIVCRHVKGYIFMTIFASETENSFSEYFLNTEAL